MIGIIFVRLIIRAMLSAGLEATALRQARMPAATTPLRSSGLAPSGPAQQAGLTSFVRVLILETKF